MGRLELLVLGWKPTRNRAKQVLSVQFGAILGLIVSFFHLIAPDNEKTLYA